MEDEWKIKTIEEVSEKVAMGPFGSSIKVDTFVQKGVPIISGQHLHGSRLDDQPGFNYIAVEHAERLRNANVQRGDVIFTHAGNIGQVAYIPMSSKYCRYIISQRQFYLRCNIEEVLPEFVVAFFKSPIGRHKLLANASQTGVPSIAQPVTYLRTIELPVPSLPEQRAIGHILGTLDDKIECNRRMNEMLEAMARALFKAWFVDFEPVRAKLDGRWQRGQSLPGLPAHLYDLFPDRLVGSELGPIPEGWDVGILGNITEHPRRTMQPDGISCETPYIALEHMPKRCIALTEWSVANGLGSNKYQFKYGEILFGKLRPYFHKVGVAPINGVCSTDIVVIAPKSPIWFSFVLGHTSSDAFVEYTHVGSTGTKMPRTSWSEMSRYSLVLPHAEIATHFNHLIYPTTEKIIASIHESRTLAQLRDTLLPKLISGELRIKDVERIVGGEL